MNSNVIGVGEAGLLGVDNSVETSRRHSAEVKSLVLLSGETLLPQLPFLRQASQLPGLFVVADDDVPTDSRSDGMALHHLLQLGQEIRALLWVARRALDMV